MFCFTSSGPLYLPVIYCVVILADFVLLLSSALLLLFSLLVLSSFDLLCSYCFAPSLRLHRFWFFYSVCSPSLYFCRFLPLVSVWLFSFLSFFFFSFSPFFHFSFFFLRSFAFFLASSHLFRFTGLLFYKSTFISGAFRLPLRQCEQASRPFGPNLQPPRRPERPHQ